MHRKLEALAKARQAREKRISKMTPEELAKYRQWQRNHKPGDPKARARARRAAQEAAEARRTFEAANTPKTDAAIEALDAQIRVLQAALDRLDAPIHDIWS
jgi:hypothetical protein